jgi:hypothetical protein
MINQQELDYLYDEVELWIQNEEPYYIQFNKVKWSYWLVKSLVTKIINDHDFSEYKTTIMYIRKVTKRLIEEYKNE